MMSANITAASTPWRRTGWSVTSAQSSGCSQTSKSVVALADLAVLGQRPARLPHEPDRRALDRLAARGADEKRLGTRPRLASRARPRSPPAGPLLATLASTCGPGRSATRRSRSRTPAPRRGAPATSKAASYHWLDERGNPIVWDGLRTPLPHAVAPGERVTLALALRGPIPPGPLPARVRPRRRAPALVRRGSATRRSSATSTWRRASSGGSRRAAATRPRSRRRRSRSCPRARRRRSRVLGAGVRAARRTGRGASSTRTRRATPLVGGSVDGAAACSAAARASSSRRSRGRAASPASATRSSARTAMSGV